MALIVLWALLVIQRLLELGIAARNTRNLLQQGAVEHGAEHYPAMVAIHSLWFAGWLWEGWAQPLTPAWLLLLAIAALGQFLRWTSIITLGERWTTRVLVLPGRPPVAKGFYSWIPHPNYVGVALELAAIPLIFGAWKTALWASVANGLLMKVRISTENRALRG